MSEKRQPASRQVCTASGPGPCSAPQCSPARDLDPANITNITNIVNNIQSRLLGVTNLMQNTQDHLAGAKPSGEACGMPQPCSVLGTLDDIERLVLRVEELAQITSKTIGA